MSKIFVLWSGGVDSTRLIWELLTLGHEVHAGYIKILNNEQQSIRELAAMESMAPFFTEAYNFKFLGVLTEMLICNATDNSILPQFPMFLTCVYHLKNGYDKIAMGYVMNDDAISFLDDITNCYNSYRPLVDHLPELIFPLIKKRKATVYDTLPEKLKPLVVWCENPSETVSVCGTCCSCKRMIEAGRQEVNAVTMATEITTDPKYDITIQEEGTP